MFPFSGFRHAAQNKAIIARLNAGVIAAVREPAFYLEGGVPDTFNGRFEVLVLHAALVLRQLRQAPEPAPAMAQALVDVLFGNLDPAMRELGVGDMAVPKRMKRLVEAFTGRSVAYDAALAAGDAALLAARLSRNVYDGARPAQDLAAYAMAAAAALADLPTAELMSGTVVFPHPAAFLGQNNA